MTSSNENIFRVAGHLCGEFAGHLWIPRTNASDAELWCFLWSVPDERMSKQWWGWWFETPSRPLWRHNVKRVPGLKCHTQIAKALGPTSIRHRFDATASGRCLIDVGPSAFANWARCWLYQFNSLSPGDAYTCQWSRSSLLQVVVWRPYETKPLPVPMMVYCQLDISHKVNEILCKMQKKIFQIQSKMASVKWRSMW